MDKAQMIKVWDKVRIKDSDRDAKRAYIMKIDQRDGYTDYLVSRKEPMLFGWFKEEEIEKVYN